MKSKLVDYSSYDSSYRAKEKLVGCENLVEQHGEGDSPDLAYILRSLKENIISCKENNDMLIEAQ